jgi:hypothetical protein
MATQTGRQLKEIVARVAGTLREEKLKPTFLKKFFDTPKNIAYKRRPARRGILFL